MAHRAIRGEGLCILLLCCFACARASAETNSIKVCIAQEGDGYDALSLARQLSSKTLKTGTQLSVVAITRQPLPPELEDGFAQSKPSFARLIQRDMSAKNREAQIEQVGCDYYTRVWRHESMEDITDTPNGPMPNGDRTMIGYELRKDPKAKILMRAMASPMTVYVHQGRRVFNPYVVFADQIVKKLSGSTSTGPSATKDSN